MLSSGKADAFSIALDGGAQTGSLAVGLEATAVKLPETGGKRFEIDLPGATAQATFAAGQPLQLTHLGLGDRTTTVSISGVPAEAVDLNPDDGRTLDASLTQDAATGAITLAVTPKLDLQRTIDHAVLGDTPPVYDVTCVVLDGDSDRVGRERPDPGDGLAQRHDQPGELRLHGERPAVRDLHRCDRSDHGCVVHPMVGHRVPVTSHGVLAAPRPKTRSASPLAYTTDAAAAAPSATAICRETNRPTGCGAIVG